MIEKQLLSNERIIDCLKTDYGIEVLQLTFLPLGASLDASIYQAEARDQSSYFIKLKHSQHADLSVTILELLQNAGVREIISPVKTIHGKPIQSIDDFTLIVYPFIEGSDGFNRNLTGDQWITLGKILRQVHEIEVPNAIQDKIRREAYSSKWRAAVRALYAQMDAESSSDEIALKLVLFMKKHIKSIQRLVDRAEELGQKIQELSPKFVLCHSDIHGGNVLISKNDSIYIVDWDEPIMAPKERDLMFIGGGVANVWNKPNEEKYFYQGYGNTEINMAILAYYRHERIVEDIAIYGQALLLTTAGGADRFVMYKQFIDMFEPNGVVDIAFKTGN